MAIISGWTETWPTVPGRYWFYGWISALDKMYQPRKLSLVTVKRHASGGFIYTIGTSFLWERDSEGLWQPAIVPELPETNDE